HLAVSLAVPLPAVSTEAYSVSFLPKVSPACVTFLSAPMALPTATVETVTPSAAAGGKGAGAGVGAGAGATSGLGVSSFLPHAPSAKVNAVSTARATSLFMILFFL